MCGIAGAVNVTITRSALDLIEHRGPDYQDLRTHTIAENEICLGHTRLSIIDLSEAGNQPMYSDCGNYAIVFNGEIYNHLELKRKLEGIRFRGHSDTETILYYIREYGIQSVDEFNGIFAFAFLDIPEGKLYLVRDHFGVKPLYYQIEDKKLMFSSELKVLLRSGADKSIDLSALDSLLTLRYNPSPQTIFKNIHKLNPASYLSYDIQRHQWKKIEYRTPNYHLNARIAEDEAVEEWARLFETAIKRQLLSDVPVGLFLSGGLDSALVGKIMTQHVSYPVRTFTVGFKGVGNYNELPDAEESARLIGSQHTAEFIERDQYLDYFRESFFHTEEPIAEPTIPALFHVARMASKEVKVVLSGQGADEPMAGYKRYYGEHLISKYAPILRLLPYGIAKKFLKSNEAYQRGIYSLQFRDELERFMAIYHIFTPELKASLYKSEIQEELLSDTSRYFEKFYREVEGKTGSLNKLLYLDTRVMLPDNLLLFNDKMTMAHSIENRVPFLDKDLVAFVESLPRHFKLRGKTRKYLEKKAALKWLPESVINRKKRGFETPIVDWFRDELYGELTGMFSESDSLSTRYFNKDALMWILDQHKTGARNFGKQIFILYSLELWYKNFYQQF
jgi:asparagine synthase (glutamine-hydrolysing)